MSDDNDKQKDASDEAAGSSDESDAASEETEKAESADEESSDDGNDEPRRRARRRGREDDADGSPAPAPPEEEAPKPKPNYIFLVVASIVFLALDLGTKEWAVKRLSDTSDTIVVVKNYFHLNLAQNKGGAWGLLGDQPDHIRLPFFFLISAIAVVFIVSLYRKLEKNQVALKWALPLVLGGALGNFVDRVRHQYVVDFIDWFYINAEGRALLDAGKSTYEKVTSSHQLSNHWPTFNIADVWIVVGVGLMVIDMFTPRAKARTRKPVTNRIVVKPGSSAKAAEPAPTSEPAEREVEGA
ncbi:MAG: signal peptidase II [Polyangiaceae bacterium]|nr:signal peptidase II [Polyangiaceae bacterium]